MSTKQATADSRREFQLALRSYEAARKRYRAAFRNAFPVGSTVTSIKRGRVACTILKHGHRDDAFVRSETGKEYWIDAYWIIEAGIR